MNRLARAVSLLVGCLALTLPSPVLARQSSQGREAAVGRSVHVVFVDGSRKTIRFLGIDSERVIGRSGAQQVQYPIDRVKRVERVTHVTRNMTLLGFGLGAVAGISAFHYHPEAMGIEPLITAGIGTGAGWLIGRLISHSTAPGRVVYAAPSRSISLSPLLSRAAVGGAVQMRWR